MNWEHLLICVKSIFPNVDTSEEYRMIDLYGGHIIDKDAEEFWTLFPNCHSFVKVDRLTEADVILSLREYKKNNSIFSK